MTDFVEARALAWAGPIVFAFTLAAGTTTGAEAQTTRALARFSQWNVYLHDDGGSRICFASAAPRSSDPKGAARDAVQFFVSGWPRDGVKSEISVKLGYPIKKASTVTVSIGQTSFNLFAAADRAFVADPTQELKLIEALKKGTTMQVEATSERGTQTRDTYSLQGVSQALQAVVAGCPL